MTVYASLNGGLGNQMFQYAAGRALALRRNAPLRLDISGFASYDLHRVFELHRIFACPAEIASASDVDRLLGWQSHSLLRRLMARPGFAAFRRDTFAVEPHFHYWPGINEVPQDCLLAGYWQSEKYFQDQEKIIRADFTFGAPMSEKNEKIADRMAQGNAVGVHVRRGDFVSNPKSNVIHGVCPPDYYRAAIRYMAERIERPRFFVFSDDMAWVKAQLKLDSPWQAVEHNQGADGYNDMRLMGLCQHHIIANSSFSWWGAWLAVNPSKIVIAPKQWFQNAPHDISDLVPPGWIRM